MQTGWKQEITERIQGTHWANTQLEATDHCNASKCKMKLTGGSALTLPTDTLWTDNMGVMTKSRGFCPVKDEADRGISADIADRHTLDRQHGSDDQSEAYVQ